MGNKETIGSRIKNILEIRQMQAKELAEIIGVSQSAMSNYLNNKRNIDNNYLAQIAKALDVTTDELLGVSSSDEISSHNNFQSLNNKYEKLPQNQKDKILISLVDIKKQSIKDSEITREIISLLPGLDFSQKEIILKLSKDLVNQNNLYKQILNKSKEKIKK